MAVSVGSAYVSVYPSVAGFGPALSKKAAPAGDHAGKVAGQRFGGSFKKALGGLALGGSLLAATMGVKRFTDAAVNDFKSVTGETLTMQRALGGSVEEMSQLRGAAQLAGVSADTFTLGMRTFTKQIYANGKAFKALGINVEDANGKVKPAGQLLKEVSDKFAKMPPGAEKSALAMKLFGRNGLDMLPMLNRGSEEIAGLEKQAKKLGITIGTKDADALKKYNKATRELTAANQGMKVSFARALFPAFAEFKDFLAKLVPQLTVAVTPALKRFGEVAVLGVQGLKQHMPQVREAVKKLAEWLANVSTSIKNNWPTIKTTVASVLDVFRRWGAWVKYLWDKFVALPDKVKAAIAAVLVAKQFGMLTPIVSALAAAFGGLNLAMLANPVTWIVIGVVLLIALLVAGFIYLYNNSEDFRNKVHETWGRLKKTFEDIKKVWDEKLWPALQKLEPLVKTLAEASLNQFADTVWFLGEAFKFVAQWVSIVVNMLDDWTPLGLVLSPTPEGGASGSFAGGGMIPGSGLRDTTPVLTTPGEWVLTRSQVQQVGVGRLEAWRQGGPPPGVSGGFTVGNLVINNPRPEPASESLPRSIRKLQHVGAA